MASARTKIVAKDGTGRGRTVGLLAGVCLLGFTSASSAAFLTTTPPGGEADGALGPGFVTSYTQAGSDGFPVSYSNNIGFNHGGVDTESRMRLTIANDSVSEKFIMATGGGGPGLFNSSFGFFQLHLENLDADSVSYAVNNFGSADWNGNGLFDPEIRTAFGTAPAQISDPIADPVEGTFQIMFTFVNMISEGSSALTMTMDFPGLQPKAGSNYIDFYLKTGSDPFVLGAMDDPGGPAVPIPAAAWLLGSGLLTLVFGRVRRRRAAAA